ncbi:MAG: hypothetical protein ACTSPN_10330 [Promethearchaeota archaeon]
MQKSDYLYMILDNILAFSIQLPPEYQGNGLNEHLDKFDENALKVVAGFNKNFLRYFLDQSRGKIQKDVEEELKKMEVISYMVGPTGNLNYFGEEQLDHVLDKLTSLKLTEIDEAKISLIADENLRQQFGGTGGGYSVSEALENQLTSAAFYLMNMGYSRQEIQEKFNKVRGDPAKLGELFNLPQKEIYSMPAELEQGQGSASTMQPSSGNESTSVDQTPSVQEAIEHHVESIHEDVTGERAQKVKEILAQIKDHVREMMSELQEKIFLQMHPDRLRRALKMLKSTRRKSKRMELYLEWFASSLLLSKIELKVEHWQVSSSAGHGDAGVFTAGIDFSRYDNVIKDFSDGKLTKIVNIARKILQHPTKKAIQKLGQDLIAETGFDEHLYFTD